MTEYTRIVFDLSTGERSVVPLTPEEIAEIENVQQSAPVVPAFVTPRQVRLLLLQQGLLDQVEAMIAQQDRATQITWAYATEFRRDDPLLNQLAVNLSLTTQQIDEFFIAASQL